jgi:hypothetical protein
MVKGTLKNKWPSNSTIFILFIIGLFVAFLVWYQFEEFQLQNDPKIKELKTIIEPLFIDKKKYNGLLSNLNDENIMEKVSLYKGKKSYTINKEKIFLCLKDENDEYYDTNFLVYVLLHELSHVICDEIGHTQKFEDTFKELLDEAVKKGVYDPSKPIITDYCEY